MSDSGGWMGECSHGNIKGRCWQCRAEQAESDRTALQERLTRLEKQWSEREQAMCRKADGQSSTLYAQRLGEQAEQIGRCADELRAALSPAEDAR